MSFLVRSFLLAVAVLAVSANLALAKRTGEAKGITEVGSAGQRQASRQPAKVPEQPPNLKLLSESATGAVNSDIAFWEQRAYVGNYSGFRIFDISNPANPALTSDVFCFGPQNDPVVWEHLLFLAVDVVLTGPECGSRRATDPTDPSGWEGVRIFDVSNPRNPKFITGVYTDCGAHTITAFPKSRKELLLYVSSYPLAPGPTCGPERAPAVGRDPLHGVIQVLHVPLDDPRATREIAEPAINYPGDRDNQFDPAEHGLPADAANPIRACHDIGVFVELRLAGSACAEQAQLWRIGRDGIPDTDNPLWVFDDESDANGATGEPGDPEVAVDFWHSATFSWDGKVVNFIDEAFGNGCPPRTAMGVGASEPNADTGRMFFLDTATGDKLSHFMLPRKEEGAYCSAHLGNTVKSPDRYLLVNAWYAGGVDVIDFDDPANPSEIAWFDAGPAGPRGSDNWSAYWYRGPSLPEGMPIYANDGLTSPLSGRGFQTFRFDGVVNEVRLGHLNPQTQERRLRD